MPPTQQHTFKNRLLARFSRDDLARFFAELEFVALPCKQIIYEAGDRIEHVYFLEEGVASLLTTMANGATIEVGMIGREGMVGIAALLGAEESAQRVIIQVPAAGHRIAVALCRAAFDGSAAVRREMLGYSDVLFNLSAQTAACNSLHTVDQRCARWLLISSDRIHCDSVPITHEFLSSMLGVRRVGVTLTIGNLEGAGLVRSERGQLTIIDRRALEGAACECYRIDRLRFDRLHSGVGGADPQAEAGALIPR
jgi:CRP-like cAMP-binding protein